MPLNHSQYDLTKLAAHGFVTTADAHDISSWGNDALTIGRLTVSLETPGEDTTPESIVRIVFNTEADNTDARFVLYLRVAKIHKIYSPDDAGNYGGPPRWYFEALIDQARFNPAPTALAVRCFIENDLTFGVMQFISGEPPR